MFWSFPAGSKGHSDCGRALQVLEWRFRLSEDLAGVSNIAGVSNFTTNLSIYLPAYEFETPQSSVNRRKGP